MDGLRQRFARPHGITRRWLVNGLGVIVVLLVLLCVLGSAAIRYYYYQQVQSVLYSRAGALAVEMRGLAGDATFDFEVASRAFVEEFTDKERMELQMIDSDGAVLMSSTGFTPVVSGSKLADFRSARVLGRGWDTWRGTSAAGEKVMALSVMVSGSGGVYGAVRCVTSLALVNRQIGLVTGGLIFVSLLILLFVAFSSVYFINSIVNPVKEISTAARRVALGDYSIRLKKWHNDELGDLSDTINYMAGEVRTAERLKDEFISSVSHELRTPLTAIKGWSETLREGTDPELTERGLRVISEEAERLSGIVEELLDFSSMQSGRMVLKPTRLDIQAELADAVFLFRDRAERERIRLQYIENEGVPPVMGDRDRLRQVFVNLLDNALKYSDPGDRVRVEAAGMGSRVQIVISDTGRGIKAADLPRVTEKFYKADKTRPGSGIGLALVDEIVQRHGGQLEIDSKEGVGTAAVITLPLELPTLEK